MVVRASVDLARWRHLMGARQRKACGAVIKIRRQPRNRIVASRAGRNRKHRSRRRMLGVSCLLPGRQVAPGMSAVGRRNLQAVVPSNMAVRTGNIGVPVRKRKIDRRGSVVDSGSQPAVKVVAGIASLRKLRGYVIRIGSLLKGRQMTRGTGGRKSLELTHCSALVAIFALHRGVSPQKREAILVILDLSDSNIPPLDCVTLSAVRAHLALMHVRVAVLAIFGHVRKDRLYMALRALHFFVHAPQRIPGFAVIELRVGSNGPPTRCCVTILARNL